MLLLGESDRTFGIVRNDGRSIHHRNELEKSFAATAAKLTELKREFGPCYCWALKPGHVCDFCKEPEIGGA